MWCVNYPWKNIMSWLRTQWKNEFQRKRVPSAKNIYSLLKDDLVTGCIIPIVLSIFDDYQNLADDKATIIDYVNEHKDNLIILDGLQRTFTIQEIYNQEDLENKSEVLWTGH